jgi:HK97 family phage portal protein|tara:strand:+ start:2615 stop:3886 length:1272 start_codon:yes stop_codon:yes gene_type:complete
LAEITKETPRWREWLSEKLNPAQPSIASLEPFASPETIVDFEQAYREIEIIHRAVEMVISACVDTPLKITGQTPAKKVNKLLNIRPNPFEDRVRFFRRALLDFHLDGNAFFYYDGNDLYLLPANDVEVVPDPHTFVNHYNYMISNQQSSDFFGYNKQTRKSEAITFQPNEIIHITNENTSSIFRGTSKLKPLLRLIELYYYMINFQRQFFKNNAIPGFVLTTDNILSKRVKERLLEGWRNSYTTIFDNARHPAILDGGLKIDQFSTVKFQELDFENSIERIQQDMAKALGVPYVLLKSGNNANIDANQKLFYQHTVMPILNQFCSAFMLFFNNGVQIKPDKLTIPALRPDERTQSIYYSTLVNTGIITPNEARVGLGFPSIDGEDSIRVPQNITGSATDATQGGRPPSEESENQTEEGTSDEG